MCRVRHQCNSMLKYNIIICLIPYYNMFKVFIRPVTCCPLSSNAVSNLYYAKGFSSEEQFLYVFVLEH